MAIERLHADQPDYNKANIPVFLLRSVARALDALGIPTHDLTLGLGFSLSDFSDPGSRFSFRQGRELILRAQKQAGGSALGLETGKRETITSIGLVGYAMTTCETVGEAITLALKLQRDAGSMLLFDLHQEDGLITVTATNRFPDPEIQMFLIEEAFASFMQIASDLIGESFKPVRVELAYPRPLHNLEYARIFGCPVHFDQLNSRFVYDASWHSHRLSTADLLNHRQVLAFLEQNQARNRENEEIIESVERVLRQRLTDRLGVREVADILFMSERTLRRRLADCGVSFSSVQERLRRERALELLSNRAFSISQIAFATGFADSHNFNRAFRRWTGKTPGALRREIFETWPK